ncbi:peptide/nickel transport system permease protein [Pseudarthrobacter sp. W1I19]|uniref:ABC transporter permease subunit n=1 Tax=Pseudarthrobacter sp. W1I19 TaxID=3042288 RepID=UPI002786E490|nr:ABC transporter permease subunit [Pseudarthrobacter sp. W1I19]MDQ0921710.1 peptide/nickel transport system permease protein [Pseudarthrobacter sp. W1I19]
MGASDSLKTTASRTAALLGLVALIGMLPWLSGRGAEYTILRARYADREPTPEALAAIRNELGLDQGPIVMLLSWVQGVMTGDLGTSWISNRPVGPGVAAALGVSVTLMGFAVAAAMLIALLMCIPAVVDGVRRRRRLASGTLSAALTSLPEFLLAAMLLVVGAVWLRWFPPYGWKGPAYAVLPALSLGIPAGGLIGLLLADALRIGFAEKWVATWRLAGAGPAQLTLAVLRRALPAVLPQIGLVLIGLTGGAVAVEKVYAIPGIGRTLLGAATAQDIPTLQAGMLVLMGLALLVGTLTTAARYLLIGPAVRLGTLPLPALTRATNRRQLAVPIVAAAALLLMVGAGLLRDPYTSSHPRLAGPTWVLPFGADASGRDLLARVGHGALGTLGTALAVVLVCLALGIAVGLFPRAAAGPLEVTNAAPPILAGLVAAAITGPSAQGAALAVAAVSWAPLAAHTAALAQEARAQPYVQILPVLGVGPARVMLRYILPAVARPLIRHAMLRLPGIALALAALGFLGLGPQQPSPEWGLILAEGIGYVERAPWAVLAPAFALVLASVLAVGLAGIGSGAVGADQGRDGCAACTGTARESVRGRLPIWCGR